MEHMEHMEHIYFLNTIKETNLLSLFATLKVTVYQFQGR